MPPTLSETADISVVSKSSNTHEEPHARGTAGALGYVFQIVFQASFFLKNNCCGIFICNSS